MKNIVTDILDAAYFGELDNIRTLLDDGADVNISGQDGNTPLHMAVLGGHTNCVGLLIEKKANVDAVNSEGNNTLHLAVATAPPDCIKLLLESGAPVNSRNNKGDTPLDYAIDQIVSYHTNEDLKRHLALIDFLLQFGADARYAHKALVENYQPRRLQTGTGKTSLEIPKVPARPAGEVITFRSGAGLDGRARGYTFACDLSLRCPV